MRTCTRPRMYRCNGHIGVEIFRPRDSGSLGSPCYAMKLVEISSTINQVRSSSQGNEKFELNYLREHSMSRIPLCPRKD